MRVLRSRMASGAVRGAKSLLSATDRAVRSRFTRNARRQLAAKNAEISALKRELARQSGGRELETGSSGVPVFFVLGYQKSGTTWLMRMLDAHPEILCKGEGRLFDGGWRQKSLKHAEVQRPASSLYHALLDAEYLRLWIERSVWSRDEPAEEHLSNLTRMAVDYFLEGQLVKTGKRLVGDKSPLLTTETIREVAGIHPEARVVHIIRDGRDAAVSAAYHARNFGQARKDADRREPGGLQENRGSIFSEDQIRKLSGDWSGRVGRATEDGPALLGDNYAEVRYEQLVTRPETEMRRLLEFLGADHGEETVRRCVEAASFEKLSEGRKRGQENPSSFFRKGVVGDWKDTFSERDRLVFKEESGDLLVRLGYESDGGW